MTWKRRVAIFALGAGAALVTLGARASIEDVASPQAPSPQSGLPHSTLAVLTRRGWATWWSSGAAPALWRQPDPALQSAATFSDDEIAYAEVSLSGSSEAWRTRLVIVRLDPHALRLQLDTASDENRYPAWRIDRAPNDAVFAVNAGQFGSRYSWGLVVLDGHRYLPAGAGSLVTTVAIDSEGRLRWASGDGSAKVALGARWAFQSYPTLLAAGAVPLALQAGGRGVDVDHRDARVAIGLLPDGRLLVAMTRFDALGTGLGFLPFGLTVPEMAAVMGALGATNAVLLDGGVSAQMLLRDRAGEVHRWQGLRSVPLALVARWP